MRLPRRSTDPQGVVVWFVLSGLVVFEHLVIASSGGAPPAPWWHSVLGTAALAVAVGVRRSHPLVTLIIAGALTLAQLLYGLTGASPFPMSNVVALSVLSWLAGRRSDSARGLVVVLVVGNLLLLLLGMPLRGDMLVSEGILSWLFMVFWSLLLVLLPWLLGRYRRQQAQLASAGWDRAERMEHEQQLMIDQARLRERNRIAQDMHDSLGHELSLIALRAGALEVASDLDERHRTAAGELRMSAATATERLGEIIGVLRERDGRPPLLPAGESIDALVERAVDSGADVRVVTERAASTIPSMVQDAAHRVVQEALTNASKHAPAAPVTVRVRSTRGETRVAVTNGPGRPIPSTAAPSGGRGLPGLRERVRLAGGSLTAGPLDDGGFEVVARLPHESAAAPVAPSGTSESAAELATVRRQARRGLVVAVAAPLGIGAALGVLILGYYVVVSYSSVLDPSDYSDLRVGQPRSEIEPVLPPLKMIDPPDADAPPPGSTCEFYRPDGPFSITYAYRLCFVDGRLAAKDTIQTGTKPIDPEDP